MAEKLIPRYPVYVPSKGRAATPLTIRFLLKDEVPFWVVVEEPEYDEYAAVVGEERLLVLPFVGAGLIGARNWIKEHSISEGHERHWQLDDNISGVWRHYRGERLYCASGPALRVCEDFVDRYENVAVAGLNYVMFGMYPTKPFVLNAHVYSCSLILNSIPHRWRLAYNDDTDLCLQVLADGWCTVLFNAFLVQKLRTMVLTGGNTTDLYLGDGRAKMARALERVWPGVVETKRRFQRPQHVVRNNWKKFDTPLRRKPGLVIPDGPDERGLRLTEVTPPKSPDIQRLLREAQEGRE